MAAPSDMEKPSVLKRFVAQVRRFARGAAETSELRRLETQQVGKIAHELGISRTDLFTLCANPDSDRLLKLRLAQLNLVEEKLERQHPEVLQDLQRVCGTCTAGARCSRDFAAGRISHRDEYCPNSWTLDALKKDAEASKAGSP